MWRWVAPLLLLGNMAGAEARPAVKPPTVRLKSTETAAGGYLLGNPKARVHVVEFMSFTCSHCAHFTAEAAVPLKQDFVASGNISYEVRNAVRDIYDLTASQLARCGGAQRFFGNMEAIMAGQSDWLKQSAALKLETRGQLSAAQAMTLIADGGGLNALMRKRGFTAAQLKQCLTDKGAREKILAMTKDAWDVRKIQGTPALVVNDAALDPATDWPLLKAQLQTALATPTPQPEVKK